MGPIPSLGWPRIWVVLTGYALMSNVFDFTFHSDSDALIMFPIMAGIFWIALWWYRQRLEQREVWRTQRFIEWLRKPLAPPSIVDWERFESKMARKVKKEENPNRLTSFSKRIKSLN